MRIVASMTTIPSRIDRIRPVLENVLSQTVPVAYIELNLPHVCIRTSELYLVPPWLEEFDRVNIFRTPDQGPITKIAPTLIRYRDDTDTYIWSVDDDIAYQKDQLEKLLKCYRPSHKQILCRYGGVIGPDGTINFQYGETPVTMFEGFGTVLYPPECIGDDFPQYVEEVSLNPDCRISDDVVLSHYFTTRGIQIFLCHSASGDEPWLPRDTLPHASEGQALHLQSGGHLDRYKRVYQILSRRNVRAR